MDIQNRLRVCHLLMSMESDPAFSKKAGLLDTSHYKKSGKRNTSSSSEKAK